MKRKLIPYLLVVLLTLPAVLPLFNAKFFYTQDHIFIARLHQIYTALFSGQFPVRWAPDLRFGEPLFNFYAPLPYYIGAVVHLLGFNYIWTAKILFIFSSIFSALAMYLLANYLFGKKGAFMAAILYTYAPYRAVDIYVRGALSETWTFIFFPLIFYASVVLAKKQTAKNVAFLSLTLAALFLTHNVMTLMFLPFLIFWWIYLCLVNRRIFITLFGFTIAASIAFGLAAFFLLPAVFERQFIQTKYLIVGYFDFRAHFVAYKQLFSTFWGYGSSLWGPVDGLSFQIGIVNWIVVVLTLLLSIIYRKKIKLLIFSLFLSVIFIFSIFIQHNKSAFIWEAIPSMAFIQFPWRFLAISIFIVSIMGAQLAIFLKGKMRIGLYILILASILSTVSYFKPKEYVEDNFFDKFLNTASMKKGVDLTKDYLPIWTTNIDGDIFDTPRAESGNIEVTSLKRTSTSMSFDIKAKAESLVEVPITYFPGWEINAANRELKLEKPSNRGLIRFYLSNGEYKINIVLKDTLIRSMGNVTSLAAILLVLFLLWKKYIFR